MDTGAIRTERDNLHDTVVDAPRPNLGECRVFSASMSGAVAEHLPTLPYGAVRAREVERLLAKVAPAPAPPVPVPQVASRPPRPLAQAMMMTPTLAEAMRRAAERRGRVRRTLRFVSIGVPLAVVAAAIGSALAIWL